MAEEKLLLNYKKQTTYKNDALNAVGATTSTTLRNITTPATATTNYVRKFGTDYLITQVTDITDPVDANMTFTVKAEDGTTLGSRTGGGAFSAGSTLSTAQSCSLEISASGGAVTVLASITIDTDVDAGGLAFNCAAESVSDGDTLTLYLSDTGSTYYDSLYKYGGGRHTPSSGDSRKPFLTITSAYNDLDSVSPARTIVHVMDSEAYDEEVDCDQPNTIIQAALGQTPTLIRGIGARITKEPSAHFDNTDTAYFNKVNGNDANAGTWQSPKLTIASAVATGKTYKVYGGTGALASETYSESGIIFSGTLEVEYGLMLTLKTGSSVINFNGNSGNIRGVTVDGSEGSSIGVDNSLTPQPSWGVYDSTIINCQQHGIHAIAFGNTLTVTRCIIRNNPNGVYVETGGGNVSIILTITQNLISSNVKGIYCNCSNASTNFIQWTYGIENNIFYNNTDGIYCLQNAALANGMTHTGDIDNNTFWNNTGYGFHYDEDTVPGGAITFNFTMDKCIFHTHGTGVFSDRAITITYCNFYNNTTDYNGNVTSNNEIAGDPKLSKLTSPYKLGLSADSVCGHADANNDDTGALLRIVEINANSVEINGFIIDGEKAFNNAVFIRDTADHVGTALKFCDVFDFQGIALDFWDDDTDTDVDVYNCKVHDSGNGIKFSFGGNDVQETLIYNNAVFGIWADYTGQSFVHDVFFNNQYGLYISSNSASILVRDCISHQNSLYGIYSSITIVVSYNDITDGTNNVDSTDTSNKTDDPLFVDTTSGSENFHLKTIEAGYLVNSACKDSASDGYDIGAYLMDRGTSEEWWKKHQLNLNPWTIMFSNDIKGQINTEKADGSFILWGKAHKRVYELMYDPSEFSNDVDRKKLDYISTLIRTRANSLATAETIIRLKLQPTSHILTGTSATVDASAKTLTDASLSLVEDEHRGYHLGIKFTSGSGTGTISASGKTLTVGASPGPFTANAYVGYYLPYMGYFYYIKSNTTNQLVLSDPDSTLVDASGVDWSVEKYFKITGNTSSVFSLLDDDSELVSGTFGWYIDFIEVKVQSSGFSYTHKDFRYDWQHAGNAYSIIFEEA